MESEKKRMSCEQARELDIVDYLARIGHEPVKIKGDNFWYLSPFRIERTASFKVDRRRNRWHDFGEGIGGNLIDFAIRYNQCTVGELLQSLSSDNFFFQKPVVTGIARVDPPAPSIKVIAVRKLFAYPLLNYLRDRRIPIEIADRYCSEVRYTIDDREYYAIGFKNDIGGYELRNAYFKGSTSPKGITTIRKECDTICVFEGFFDFMSFLALIPDAVRQFDFLVLNSLSFLKVSIPVLAAYPAAWLFLHNDTSGRNATVYAMSQAETFSDKGYLSRGYKDLNEYLCQPGRKPVSLNIDQPPP